jgi:hypothetical protein
LIFINCYSQELVFKNGVKETHHFGAILPHRQEVNENVEGHTYAVELSFYRTTSGKRNWHQIYKHPKIGVSALYLNFGNPDELGEAIGVFPFVELPLSQKKVNWRLKMGYGLGYVTKPFDRVTNYKNVVIGSPINALIYLNMLWDIPLGERFNLAPGLSLIHFSNGSFARPNLGVNTGSLNVGFTYNFGEKVELEQKEIEYLNRVWKKQVMVGFGIKEIPPVDGPKYFVNTYSFNFMKQGKAKSSFGFGADFFYNSSIQNLILTRDSSYQTTGMDNFRLGFSGIYSLNFGKISFLMQMGGYAFTQHKDQGYIYHRFTTRYQMGERLFINLGLKTHYAVADYVEFGAGYTFGK